MAAALNLSSLIEALEQSLTTKIDFTPAEIKDILRNTFLAHVRSYAFPRRLQDHLRRFITTRVIPAISPPQYQTELASWDQPC